MFARAPIMTEAGKDLLLRSILGETITFTKFKVGSGELTGGATGSALTDLIDAKVTFGIAGMSGPTNGAVTISGSFSSSDVQADFRLRELGLFAKIGNEAEKLYCYINDGVEAGTMKKNNSNVAAQHHFTMVVEVGEAQNISVVISSTLYTLKSEFDAHVNATNNPHGVTKAQLGLGNVPNVATNDQEPTFEEASTLENIASGEKFSVILGKIKKAITYLTTHKHGAADITSGVLSVARGGTGQSSLTNIARYFRNEMKKSIFDLRGHGTISDLDAVTTPGVYFVNTQEGATLPYTTTNGNNADLMTGILFVFYAAYNYNNAVYDDPEDYPETAPLIWQLFISNPITIGTLNGYTASGLPVEIKRREGVPDIDLSTFELRGYEWGVWE